MVVEVALPVRFTVAPAPPLITPEMLRGLVTSRREVDACYYTAINRDRSAGWSKRNAWIARRDGVGSVDHAVKAVVACSICRC